MDCSPPCSSVHEISQARILEWVAMGALPDPGIEPASPASFALAGRFFTTAPPGKPTPPRPPAHTPSVEETWPLPILNTFQWCGFTCPSRTSPAGCWPEAAASCWLPTNWLIQCPWDLPGYRKLNADSFTQGPLRAAFRIRCKERRLWQGARELCKQLMQGLSAPGHQNWRRGAGQQ